MHGILKNLQRKTNRKRYLPEVDGLRFLAIVPVILFHLNAFFEEKTHQTFEGFYFSFAKHGGRGVILFFVISGFILAYPFAEYYLKQQAPIGLKSYYQKRIFRIEPPYVVSMVFLFLAKIALGVYTFKELFPRLLSSLTYTHNFLYGEGSWVNAVAWSLEVEIQFYILAPLFFLVFKLQAAQRRVALIGGMLLFIFLNTYLPLNFTSLYEYLSYFLLGILLCDFSITKEKTLNGKVYWLLFSPLLLLVFLFDLKHESSIEWMMKTVLFHLSIFGVYYLVFHHEGIKKLSSLPILTVIGGMCYTLYLWHYPVISLVGNPLLQWMGNFTIITYIIFVLILLMAILLIGVFWYKLIEQPTMKKDWWKKT